MEKSVKTVAVVLAVLFLFSLVAVILPGGAYAEEEGEITVHNDSDRDLYIVIAGKNQGTVSSGSSETYSCKYGSHRVTAEWDGGSASKYVTVSKTYPHADVTFSQDDVK